MKRNDIFLLFSNKLTNTMTDVVIDIDILRLEGMPQQH